MAYEGGPIGWVATHRRHHVFADEPGAAADLEAARAQAGGRVLAEVAEDEDVVALVDRWDLLWYAPEELDASAS